ncbi:transmembrane protein 245 [Cylas formicarius]|uniref:transmembrane protein 245 n=1 Tax=Cylas formicarius TaxID=197179 RepID=UPI0029587029|nr:transmembrane protein 245 [Cylas formicarius]
MEVRSPLDTIFNVIGGLPRGHDKPVKQALYNAVALLLLFLCSAATFGLYVILQPFVKPLMWSVLVGSALHPLKRSLRDKFQDWFSNLDETNTPAIFGVVLLPLNIFNEVSECVGQFLYYRFKLIAIVFVLIIISVLLYFFVPSVVLSITWSLICWTYRFLNFFIDSAHISIVLITIIGYTTLVVFVWKPENNIIFHYTSLVVWFLVMCSFARAFGSFQMPIFILLQVVFFGGFISEIYEVYTYMNGTGHSISLTDLLLNVFHNKPLELDVSEEDTSEINNEDKAQKSEVSKPILSPKSRKDAPESIKKEDPQALKSVRKEEDPWTLELFRDELKNRTTIDAKQIRFSLMNETKPKEKPMFQRSISQPYFHSGRLRRSNLISLRKKIVVMEPEEAYESTFYLYSVFWACVAMFFWKNVMFLPLLLIPILYYVAKHFGIYLGVWMYLSDKFSCLVQVISDWCDERHDALVPVPVRGLYKVVEKVNATVKSSLKSSIDTVASCVVMFGIIVFVISASIFIFIQIYAETIMLIQLTGNAINQTVVHNPELRQLLPPSLDDTLDSVLENAYQYGREGISKAVKSVMSDVDSTKSAKIEQQVLELWDRAYQSWMSSDDINGPKVTDDAVASSWEAFVRDVQKSPEIFNINGLFDFAKQNVGTLLALLESVWGIVVNNISLIVSSFSTCLSILLGGGTAVLNFILNMIVFLTTLFYLLNSSCDIYKPVELLTKFSASGRRFGHALEGAIYSVFSASFKMALFYGLWTWFIHNLFGVKIVYLPSAFATILGAIPFLGTYWACVPAVLDLWLAQDRWLSAILFAGVQFLPTSVVDTSIYSEIKGGHPYLTGLAIAGGIFCLGVEGAIIGPLLLCGLYVAIDLSSTIFKESPVDENVHLSVSR